MYLLNISIHCQLNHYDAILSTLTTVIRPELVDTEGVVAVELMEILIDVDPSMRSLALGIKTNDLERGNQIVDRLMSTHFARLTRECGGHEQLLTFTTPMLIID